MTQILLNNYAKRINSRSATHFYGMKITAADTLGGTRDFYFSDHDTIFEGVQYAGLIQRWDRVDYQGGGILRPSYRETDVQITLSSSGRLIDNLGIGHTILDAMNGWEFIGAQVVIFKAIREVLNPAASDVPVIFDGRIHDVPDAGGSQVVLLARADPDSDDNVNEIISEKELVREDDRGDAQPFIIGDMARIQPFQDRTNRYYTAPTPWGTGLNRLFDLVPFYQEPGLEALVTNTQNRILKVNQTFASQNWSELDEGTIRILMGEWGDSKDYVQRVNFPEVNSGAINQAAGELQIVGDSEGRVVMRRAFIPPATGQVLATDDRVTGLQSPGNFTNWQSAVEPDLRTWASISYTGATPQYYLRTYGQTGNYWTGPHPVGAKPFIGVSVETKFASVATGGLPPGRQSIDATTPGKNYGWAIVWADNLGGNVTFDVQFGLWGFGRTIEPVVATGLALKQWHFVFYDLQDAGDTGANGLLYRITQGRFNNESPDAGGSLLDGFGVRSPTTDITFHIHSFGVSLLYDDPPVVTTSIPDTTGSTIDKAKLIWAGRGGTDPTSVNDPSPVDHVLSQTWIQGGRGKIAAGDITTTPGVFGSVEDFRDELDTLNASIVGSSRPFVAVVREHRLATLRDVESNLSDELYADIRRSSRTGKYIAVNRDHDRPVTLDASGDPRRLTIHELQPGGFRARRSRSTEIRNAVSVRYGWDPMSRKYKYRQFVDGTGGESFDWEGFRDGTLEAYTQASQDVYGRRELPLSFDYLQDHVAVWNTIVRRVRIVAAPRVYLLMSVHPWFGWDLDVGMVFQTDATIDKFYRYPGLVTPGSESEPSWEDRKFQVLSVGEAPRETLAVDAIEIDDKT